MKDNFCQKFIYRLIFIFTQNFISEAKALLQWRACCAILHWINFEEFINFRGKANLPWHSSALGNKWHTFLNSRELRFHFAAATKEINISCHLIFSYILFYRDEQYRFQFWELTENISCIKKHFFFCVIVTKSCHWREKKHACKIK